MFYAYIKRNVDNYPVYKRIFTVHNSEYYFSWMAFLLHNNHSRTILKCDNFGHSKSRFCKVFGSWKHKFQMMYPCLKFKKGICLYNYLYKLILEPHQCWIYQSSEQYAIIVWSLSSSKLKLLCWLFSLWCRNYKWIMLYSIDSFPSRFVF